MVLTICTLQAFFSSTSSLSRIHYVRQTPARTMPAREEIVEAKFSMKGDTCAKTRQTDVSGLVDSEWNEKRLRMRRPENRLLIFRWLRKRLALETERSHRAWEFEILISFLSREHGSLFLFCLLRIDAYAVAKWWNEGLERSHQFGFCEINQSTQPDSAECFC